MERFALILNFLEPPIPDHIEIKISSNTYYFFLGGKGFSLNYFVNYVKLLNGVQQKERKRIQNACFLLKV